MIRFLNDLKNTYFTTKTRNRIKNNNKVLLKKLENASLEVKLVPLIDEKNCGLRLGFLLLFELLFRVSESFSNEGCVSSVVFGNNDFIIFPLLIVDLLSSFSLTLPVVVVVVVAFCARAPPFRVTVNIDSIACEPLIPPNPPLIIKSSSPNSSLKRFSFRLLLLLLS